MNYHISNKFNRDTVTISAAATATTPSENEICSSAEKIQTVSRTIVNRKQNMLCTT